MKKNILIILSLFIFCCSIFSQTQGSNSEISSDSTLFINLSPPIKLKYSQAWTKSHGMSQAKTDSEIHPEIILGLETEPTSDIPSVRTSFLLLIDSTYNKSLINGEKSYLEYLKTQMSKEYPFKYVDSLTNTIIGKKSFLTLTAYTSMMGYFIHIEYSICLYEGDFIIVTKIFDNEDDLTNLNELISEIEIGED